MDEMYEEVRDIEVRWIQPNRRLVFDADALMAACRNMVCQGQEEPITIEFDGSSFRIVDGERRWRACCKIGLRTVRAVVVTE